MTYVERIHEYSTMTDKAEAAAFSEPEDQPPPDWCGHALISPAMQDSSFARSLYQRALFAFVARTLNSVPVQVLSGQFHCRCGLYSCPTRYTLRGLREHK